MTKQNYSKKSKANSKKKSSTPIMTNRGEYRTRKCLKDDQRIEYDKVKTAIIEAWQTKKMHGSYRTAAICEEHLNGFMEVYPKINNEPIKMYKKLLMGVLKDQQKSKRVLREEGSNKTLLIQTETPVMLDGLLGND